ncbi:hypothetical protein R6Q59_019523, partial [Mikania micrantha]
PLLINTDDLTLTLNPNAWTQMANIVFVDMPAGAGFSYAETQEGWVSSDTILAANYKDFIKRSKYNLFKILNLPQVFVGNPLYISGISYSAIIVPKVTLELYEGNQLMFFSRSSNNTKNISFIYLNFNFMDFNSRLEYAHRMALISDDIYQSAINNCNGNYLDTMRANSACREVFKLELIVRLIIT